jgi:hypothetical protein
MAAIGEYECTHGYAVLGARGHESLLKVELEIKKPRGKRGEVLPKARVTEWVRTWQEQFGWVDMWSGILTQRAQRVQRDERLASERGQVAGA